MDTYAKLIKSSYRGNWNTCNIGRMKLNVTFLRDGWSITCRGARETDEFLF